MVAGLKMRKTQLETDIALLRHDLLDETKTSQEKQAIHLSIAGKLTEAGQTEMAIQMAEKTEQLLQTENTVMGWRGG